MLLCLALPRTSPGQAAELLHTANAGFCPVIKPTPRYFETMHVHTHDTHHTSHRHIVLPTPAGQHEPSDVGMTASS
jgi:hypothetical protein